MPYLDPVGFLDQTDDFLRGDVRSAIPEAEGYVRAQVGSMASSISFLARELAAMHPALVEQEAAFTEALADIEAEIADWDDADPVETALGDARARLEEAPDPGSPATIKEREDALLAALDDLLAVADSLPPDRARTVRAHLYTVLTTRVDSQLAMLNGDIETGGDPT